MKAKPTELGLCSASKPPSLISAGAQFRETNSAFLHHEREYGAFWMEGIFREKCKKPHNDFVS